MDNRLPDDIEQLKALLREQRAQNHRQYGPDEPLTYVQDELKSSWHEGTAFVFTNKARSRIKVLRFLTDVRP